MQTFAKPLLTLALVGLVAAAFAGCLSNAPKTSGETAISRVYTLDTDSKTLSSVGGSKSPADAMRQLLKTDLVVRVADAGAYTLSYTDAQGVARTAPLADLVPGTPHVVSGADPMAPATLKNAAGDVKATRGPLNATWWHAGDVPLGFTLAPGASASYATTSLLHEGVTLTNVKAENNVTLDTARLAFTLPVEGSFAYTLGAPGADGAPLASTLDLHVPANAADLLLVDATGSMDGKPGTAGVDVSAATAQVNLGATTWWDDGGPTATRFDGGHATFQPSVTAWVTGGFVPQDGADASNCIGKSRADNCHPEQLNGTTQDWPAGEKQAIAASDLPRSTTSESRDVTTFLKALFALDMQPGDALRVSMRDSSREGSNVYDVLETSSLEVVDQEKVTVPAGTFDALKVVQEARIVTNVDRLSDGSSAGPSIENLRLNETVARSTYWFDAKTYQPVKMETSLPFDVDAAAKAIIRAVQPGAWKTASLETLSPDQVKLELTATATLQATKLADAPTLVSPVVALGLAQTLAAGAAYAPVGFAASSAGLSPAALMPNSGPPPEIEMIPTPAPYPYPTPTPPTSSPNIHWHALFDVYVNGERMQISPSTAIALFYEGGARFLPAHLHQCNPRLLHNEGDAESGSLAALFNVNWGSQGGALKPDDLTIPEGATLAGDYAVDETHALRLFESDDNGPWQEVDVTAPITDHARYVLVYGDETPDQVAAYEAAMPEFTTGAVC